MYQLEVKNVGRMPEAVMVFVNERRIPAMFYDRRDAVIAGKIIEMLRCDSAFEYVRVV